MADERVCKCARVKNNVMNYIISVHISGTLIENECLAFTALGLTSHNASYIAPFSKILEIWKVDITSFPNLQKF